MRKKKCVYQALSLSLSLSLERESKSKSKREREGENKSGGEREEREEGVGPSLGPTTPAVISNHLHYHIRWYILDRHVSYTPPVELVPPGTPALS